MNSISVAATKKKRGRPKAFGWMDDDPQAKVLSAILTAGKSNRVRQHLLYMAEAMAALRDAGKPNPKYAWFDGPKVRLGVMAELGRTAVTLGYEAARVLADILVRDLEMEPDLTTRSAERWLRRERLAMLRRARDGNP